MNVVVRVLFLVVPVASWTLLIRHERQKPKDERFGSKRWHWPAAIFGLVGVIGWFLLLTFASPK
jgi:hypothetical protein